MSQVFETFAKWRKVFAMWHLGDTVHSEHPRFKAMSDLRELTMFLRAETNALAIIMVEKGIMTREEYTKQIEVECGVLSKQYERKFPGFKAAPFGLDINVALARDTTQGWNAP